MFRKIVFCLPDLNTRRYDNTNERNSTFLVGNADAASEGNDAPYHHPKAQTQNGNQQGSSVTNKGFEATRPTRRTFSPKV